MYFRLGCYSPFIFYIILEKIKYFTIIRIFGMDKLKGTEANKKLQPIVVSYCSVLFLLVSSLLPLGSQKSSKETFVL